MVLLVTVGLVAPTVLKGFFFILFTLIFYLATCLAMDNHQFSSFEEDDWIRRKGTNSILHLLITRFNGYLISAKRLRIKFSIALPFLLDWWKIWLCNWKEGGARQYGEVLPILMVIRLVLWLEIDVDGGCGGGFTPKNLQFPMTLHFFFLSQKLFLYFQLASHCFPYQC